MRVLCARSTIVPATSGRAASVCSFASIADFSAAVPLMRERSVRMTVFTDWAGLSAGAEPTGTIPVHEPASAVARSRNGAPALDAPWRPLTLTYSLVLPQLLSVIRSSEVPSLVEPPIRLRTCALAYESGLKAEGENADGEKADGENADGENADGENADG